MIEHLEATEKLVRIYDNDYKIFNDIKKHSSNVTNLSKLIGKELKIDNKELNVLIQAALLHDYGKYYVPRGVLLKPSKLTFEEMIIMKKHAYYGYKIAISKNYSKDIADCILYHHENYDGTGYYGVKGDFIPLCSRIIRIADVYDALTSDRTYRNALSKEKALKIMDNEKMYYDKNIYELFINNIVENL